MVADIACGTGVLADRIECELHPDKVYGVDMSEGMLAQAQARSSKVQWLRGPAEQLPVGDGTLDAVVTTSAFHFFDQPAALREFHRALSAGGLAAVATIGPLATPSAASSAASALRHPGESRAHIPSSSEMRALFEDAGFTIREQHRVRRPVWTRIISDLITVGAKSGLTGMTYRA